MLKDQNAAQEDSIKSLKRDIVDLEHEKAKLEDMRNDLDYSLKNAQFNEEILKNQLEQINLEKNLLSAEFEKKNKSFNSLKKHYQRQQLEIEYAKKGKQLPASKRERSMDQTPRGRRSKSGKGKK